jgi:hypothetical protein
MTDEPLDLDKHRGMAAQKAVDLRRTLAQAENHARELRERRPLSNGVCSRLHPRRGRRRP